MLKRFEQVIIVALISMMVLVVLISTVELAVLIAKDNIAPPRYCLGSTSCLKYSAFF